MDQASFQQEVRSEIFAPALEAMRLAKLEELIRRGYAEMAERELTPMRAPARGLTDAELDDPRRGQGDRGRA